MCIKVEQQNLRKGQSRKENPYSNSYAKKEFKRAGGFQKEKFKEEPTQREG